MKDNELAAAVLGILFYEAELQNPDHDPTKSVGMNAAVLEKTLEMCAGIEPAEGLRRVAPMFRAMLKGIDGFE